jgi:two-component system response regulator YesN
MEYQVYIVDDEELELDYLRTMLPWSANGFSVVGSNSDPLAAFAEIVKMRPEVVITDVNMPQLNGIDLIKRLREQLDQLEIVVISAYSDYEYLHSSLKLGVFDYLLKPVNLSQASFLLQQLQSRLSEKETAADPPPPVDHGKLRPELAMIIEYIEKHLSEKHTLSSLSQQFHLSSNTICSYFNRYLDTTFVNYLTDIRMKRAEELLATTGKTVKEIAILCGYSDYFYFCRIFQSYFHCTPTQLRMKEAQTDGKG